MNKPVRMTPAADGDLFEYAAFLEDRAEGLGLRFIAAVEEATDQLSRFPKSGRVRPHRLVGVNELRSWGVNDFPSCLIFYEDQPTSVVIFRVLHAARDLDKWLGA